jgi:pilus assembly protein CpaD
MSSNRASLTTLAILGAAALLAACATPHEPPVADQSAPTPTEQYPLKARELPGELKLAVHAEGLSASQRDALADLADHWSDAGGGEVTVRVPSAGVDPRSADLASRQAMDFLAAMGVPSDRLRRVGYAPEAGAGAPIVVAYVTYRAVIPRCGREWENLSSNGKNKPMGNFGCATSANLAAQIADPADIAHPRDLDPTDAGRRTTVIDKYRQGQATGGEADKNASGTLSSIGGGSN